MNRLVIFFMLWVATAFGGCGPSVTTAPFLYSSLDANGGNIVTRQYSGYQAEDIKTRIIEIFKSKNCDLVKSNVLQNGQKLLVFKNQGDLRTLVVGRGSYANGTGSSYVASKDMQHESKFFVTIEQTDSGTSVHAFGVPMLNGHMSCPPDLMKTVEEPCETKQMGTWEGVELKDAVANQWGLDISGALELELISSVLAELEELSM